MLSAQPHTPVTPPAPLHTCRCLVAPRLCGTLPPVLLQQLRAPHLTLGSIGSMGRAKCHVEMSGDGRFVAAGGADGQVRGRVYIVGWLQS
jgi:hypothetical protein